MCFVCSLSLLDSTGTSPLEWHNRCRTCSWRRVRRGRDPPPPALPSASTETSLRSSRGATPPLRMPTFLADPTVSAKYLWVSCTIENIFSYDKKLTLVDIYIYILQNQLMLTFTWPYTWHVLNWNDISGAHETVSAFHALRTFLNVTNYIELDLAIIVLTQVPKYILHHCWLHMFSYMDLTLSWRGETQLMWLLD